MKHKKKLKYKQFIAEYEKNCRVYFGYVINCGADLVTFQSSVEDDMQREFEASVDDYLDCKSDFVKVESKGAP